LNNLSSGELLENLIEHSPVYRKYFLEQTNIEREVFDEELKDFNDYLDFLTTYSRYQEYKDLFEKLKKLEEQLLDERENKGNSIPFPIYEELLQSAKKSLES